ncbi:hypothetical protein [Acidovorax sp.]|uniref:hypothetical protein n=1 Tax=Acidovorax sp. TaxID=1872122 RepID=UPI002ACE7059|nr:hypothetical protein [Acidovorax sp.]MDZ7862431.1 hypothetical protein [Acidovorax sp.]
MIEWAWMQRLIEGLKPQAYLKNWGDGAVQVGCVQGNVTVVNLVLPMRSCCGTCGSLSARSEEHQR